MLRDLMRSATRSCCGGAGFGTIQIKLVSMLKRGRSMMGTSTVRAAVRRGIVCAFLMHHCCYSIYAPYDPVALPPAYCTVYTHLVKSGGTSVKNQLYRQSVAGGMPRPGLCTSDGRTTAEMCYAAIHNSTIIMGYGEELRNGLIDVGRECEFFTMMRNPIDRALSAFFYCPTDHDVQTSRPEKWCGNAEGQELPIVERFMEFVQHMFRNTAYQSLYRSMICSPGFELCKPEHQVEDGSRPTFLESELSWEILRQVEELLLSYKAVGVFEHWDLSMQLFDATISSPVQRWDADIADNPGEQSSAREELTEWAHIDPGLHNLLSADIHIYNFSIALFKRQTTAILGTSWE